MRPSPLPVAELLVLLPLLLLVGRSCKASAQLASCMQCCAAAGGSLLPSLVCKQAGSQASNHMG